MTDQFVRLPFATASISQMIDCVNYANGLSVPPMWASATWFWWVAAASWTFLSVYAFIWRPAR